MRNLIWFMLEREIIWEVIRVRFSLWIHRLGLVCSVDCFRSCLNLWAPPLCSLLSKCAYMLLFVAGYQAVAWCHWYSLWLAAREGHWNWANIHCSCSIQKWEWIREAWQASGQPVANLRWLGKEVTWWQWGSKPRRLLEKGTTDEHERLLHAMSLWESSILPRVSVTSCSSLFLYWVPWNFKKKMLTCPNALILVKLYFCVLWISSKNLIYSKIFEVVHCVEPEMSIPLLLCASSMSDKCAARPEMRELSILLTGC